MKTVCRGKSEKAQIRNDPGGPKWKTNGLLCPDSGGWGAEPLDIYPALTLKLPYYEKQDLLIVGIAADLRMRRCLRGGSSVRSTKRPAV